MLYEQEHHTNYPLPIIVVFPPNARCTQDLDSIINHAIHPPYEFQANLLFLGSYDNYDWAVFGLDNQYNIPEITERLIEFLRSEYNSRATNICSSCQSRETCMTVSISEPLQPRDPLYQEILQRLQNSYNTSSRMTGNFGANWHEKAIIIPWELNL